MQAGIRTCERQCPDLAEDSYSRKEIGSHLCGQIPFVIRSCSWSCWVVGLPCLRRNRNPFGKVEKDARRRRELFRDGRPVTSHGCGGGNVGDDFTAREKAILGGATDESISKASNTHRANRYSGGGVTTEQERATRSSTRDEVSPPRNFKHQAPEILSR